MSSASERENGRASDPGLTSRFLVDPDHSALDVDGGRRKRGEKRGKKGVQERKKRRKGEDRMEFGKEKESGGKGMKGVKNGSKRTHGREKKGTE